MGKNFLAVSFISAAVVSNVVWANESALLKRIERLERVIQGQGLVSLSVRVDQQQNEIQKLNGSNETLNHKFDEMQRRQRELYLDINQRLEVTAEKAIAGIYKPVSVTTERQSTIVTAPTTADEITELANDKLAVKNETGIEAILESTENGEESYQSALQMLRIGQYEQAAASLVSFPKRYPQSSYLPNAFYWQGEANYVLHNFNQSIIAFQTVIDHFPSSGKVADAMLKQGFSQYELGQMDVAKTTLITVMQQYPNTSASRLAKVRLDRIKKQIK